MGSISRRQSMALGTAGGVAFLATLGGAQAGDEKARVIVADEKEVVLFKVKDVTIDSVDETKRMIAATLGRKDAPIKLTGLPLAKGIGIRVSLVEPGTVNNLPFDMDRLKGLVGKQVSVLLRADASGLAVDSIAVAND